MGYYRILAVTRYPTSTPTRAPIKKTTQKRTKLILTHLITKYQLAKHTRIRRRQRKIHVSRLRNYQSVGYRGIVWPIKI